MRISSLDRRRPPGQHVRAHRAGLQPGHRPAERRGRACEQRRGRRRGRERQGGRARVASDLAVPALRHAVRLPRVAAQPGGRARQDHHRRARQGALGRARRDRARAGERRVRVRRTAADEGRLQRAGRHRRRRLLDPPAARRRRRHHAVQLPGDGAAVDVRERDRVRQRVRAQAVGEGPVRLAVPRRALEGSRAAGRRLHRRAGRQGSRRRAADARGRRCGEFRRLDADRALHLRDRHVARQAGAGSRRREEPHGRAARRRPRSGRRRRGVRGVRRGRRAVHGGVRDRCGRRRRRRARGRDRGATSEAPRRRRRRPGHRHGPADHPRAPRQGGGLHRLRRVVRRDRRGGRTRGGRTGRRLLPRHDVARQRLPRHGGLPRRDLRAGAVRRARRHATTRRSRW